ncbi:hypothetical protein [Streptomyces sp. NPDC002133]|uniref:hypothetical protein n=1 Tax=Streptomyces sp. NPDC002133 TaxID=3154409 RepID=UPI00331B428D
MPTHWSGSPPAAPPSGRRKRLRRGRPAAPTAGPTGADRPDFDRRRLTLHGVVQGPQEALDAWLRMEGGQRALAIIGTDLGGLREYTPGELAADLLRDPRTDRAQLSAMLSRLLLYRRPDTLGLERGWSAAAAAWAVHMRAFAGYPPPEILAHAGVRDDATTELITSTPGGGASRSMPRSGCVACG